MALRAPSRGTSHVDEPALEADVIRSGDQLAPIVHRGANASIGEGADGSLWILVHDAQRRPRGRDPGTFVDAIDISYEINGLVRVLDRRVARDTLERLVGDLTGQGARIEGSLTRGSRIPDGDYAGIVVESVEGHYRVRASGAAAKRLGDVQPLGPDRWLVLAGEESRLRRVLVNQLMPIHHRVLWAMTRQAVQLLIGLGVAFAALSVLSPLAAPFAVLAALALGAFHWRRQALVGRLRAWLVQPHIDRTLGVPTASDARAATAHRTVRRNRAS